MNRWSKISGLGAVAATVLAVGSLATVAAPARTGAPAAGVAREADDSPPVNRNDGHLGSPAQVAHARQQAMSIPVGDQASWQFAGPTNIGGRSTWPWIPPRRRVRSTPRSPAAGS